MVRESAMGGGVHISLAVGALFILLMEIALTRWIAISRRSGEETVVSFEDKFEPSAQFKAALKEVQEV